MGTILPTLGRRVAVYVVLALVAWLAVWAVGRSTSVQSAEAEVAEMHGRNAIVALRGYRASRKATEAETRKREAAERRLSVADANLAKVGITVTASLDSARATLADTTATIVDLRRQVANLVNVTERYVNEVSRYRADVDSLTQAFHGERLAFVASLALADSTIAAQGRAIAAWKQAAECRVLWMKCPTRVQSFIGGGIVVAVIAAAAK